jgi:hypothetical protein
MRGRILQEGFNRIYRICRMGEEIKLSALAASMVPSRLV